jgi:CheY-like chemotaxis protein
LHSTPGEGSTFEVYFPVHTPDPTEDQARSVEDDDSDETPVPVGQGEHILVIDDELALVNLLRSFLEQLGCRVTTQTSSVDALEAFRLEPARFDVVITDQVLPGVTGLELAAEMIRARPDLPILMCTGAASPAINKTIAAAVGIRDYLNKPVYLDDLARCVRRALEHDERPDPGNG